MAEDSTPVITIAQARQLRRLITKCMTAAQDHAWIGAQDPEDRAAILDRAARAEKNLDDYITKLRGGMKK